VGLLFEATDFDKALIAKWQFEPTVNGWGQP
jgi:hypothetical protein